MKIAIDLTNLVDRLGGKRAVIKEVVKLIAGNSASAIVAGVSYASYVGDSKEVGRKVVGAVGAVALGTSVGMFVTDKADEFVSVMFELADEVKKARQNK